MKKNYDSICFFRSNVNNIRKRVCWELTTDCNLNCQFCHRMLEKNNCFQYEKLDNVIKLLKDNHIDNIIISGGEPLLYPRIFEILEKLFYEKFEVDLCTNGVLITDSIAKRLKPYMSEISVSIDGYEKNRHEKMRATLGCFEKTINGIENLTKNGIEVHTTTVVDEGFVDDIERMVDFLRNINVKSMSFIGLIPINTGYNPLLSDEFQNRIKRNVDYVRRVNPDLSINTKQLLRVNDCETCGAGNIVFGLDCEADKLYRCLLTRKRLNKEENQGEVGFCPGSKYITGKGNVIC